MRGSRYINFFGGSRGIKLSNAVFMVGSAQGTAIGVLTVEGGTGVYTFTLTDSAGNKVQVAAPNGRNLQVGATVAGAGSFQITVHADNGAGSTFDKIFTIVAVAASSDTLLVAPGDTLLVDVGNPLLVQ